MPTAKLGLHWEVLRLANISSNTCTCIANIRNDTINISFTSNIRSDAVNISFTSNIRRDAVDISFTSNIRSDAVNISFIPNIRSGAINIIKYETYYSFWALPVSFKLMDLMEGKVGMHLNTSGFNFFPITVFV